MAQKKSQTTTTKKKTASKSPAKKNSAKKRAGYSRLTLTLVFFVLGVLTFLAYLNSDGLVIKFLRDLLSGLLGGGFYLLPPALLVCAALYGFSAERPKTGRVVSVMLVPLIVGEFCQVFSKNTYTPELASFAALWRDGQELVGGGAVAGYIASVLVYLISRPGAIVLLVCLSAVVAVAALGLTWSAIASWFHDRFMDLQEKGIAAEEERIKREDEAQEERRRRAEKIAADRQRLRETEAARKPAIDIPMDGEQLKIDEKTKKQDKAGKKDSLFNSKPNALSPDQLFTNIFKKDDTQEEPKKPEPPRPEESGPEPVKPQITEPADEQEPEIIPAVQAKVKQVPRSQTPSKPTDQPVSPAKPKQETKPRDEKSFADLIEESAKKDLNEAFNEYRFPPIELLEEPKASSKDAAAELAATKDRLEMILHSFGINSSITNIINGPSVTRYEMELEIGVKLNKLTGLADDIALALGVGGVRIAAIPNKVSTVGIEVPNKNTSTVWLRELIDSRDFDRASSKLTFCLGKNIGGEVMLGNINKLPHLLVAGTTGSGKSVCLNSLILSLMYKATPEEVKFIMIDPKMVEFKIYNGIPHLLVPVVTEAKKAAGALQWAVTEMMKRYRLFSDAGARDIKGYNEILKSGGEKPMPFVVVIIDELADLMMVAAKEVEESICRVAQMGRAAGVHLVIATQSPRADVITGLMKANIPSRIAFKVASSLESRIILDAGGAADKLMGNGDMLFAPIGTTKPIRIQGAWVSDEEREKIVEFVKSTGEASYSEDVIYEIEKAAEDKGSKSAPAAEEPKASDYDELIPQAVEVIFETKQASVSMLQRRLKLGYARAARLVDQMEEIGVVGPFEGSKPRQILLTREQWHEMQFGSGTAPIEAPVQLDMTDAADFTEYADDLPEE